jgi:hypothetical protein
MLIPDGPIKSCGMIGEVVKGPSDRDVPHLALGDSALIVRSIAEGLRGGVPVPSSAMISDDTFTIGITSPTCHTKGKTVS